MLTARALHTAQKAEGTQKFDVLSFAALVAGSRAAAGLNGLDSSEVKYMYPFASLTQLTNEI